MSWLPIELKDVTKNYLQTSFNLEIRPSDCLLVTGSNGSGKTTLLRLILGFTKPDHGIITICKKLKIGYLPEKAELPLFTTALDYLLMIAKIKKVELDIKMLNELNIPLFKKINHLSKGNHQRVAIAATLIGKSDLIILDEPLSGLDRKTTNALIRIIKKMMENNQSFIISSHSPNAFKKLATNFLELWSIIFLITFFIKELEY